MTTTPTTPMTTPTMMPTTPTAFKSFRCTDTYEFEPIKELVLTMHFGFIDKLKKGWNLIYKAWLDKLKQHLKKNFSAQGLVKQLQIHKIMQYSTGNYVGISTEKIVVRQT